MHTILIAGLATELMSASNCTSYHDPKQTYPDPRPLAVKQAYLRECYVLANTVKGDPRIMRAFGYAAPELAKLGINV